VALNDRSKDTLIYVHGTNGSGKSTLARAVLAAAGGPKAVDHLPGTPKGSWTTTPDPGMCLVGKYLTSCGGVDGILPYALTYDILDHLTNPFQYVGVLAEGLVTPGKGTCTRFAALFDRAVFILLDTPEQQCIENVLKRRAAAGNEKPYSPDNLYKKARSARMWVDNLERAGLEVHRLQFPDALRLSLAALHLPPYSDLL